VSLGRSVIPRQQTGDLQFQPFHLFLTAGFFCTTILFYKSNTDESLEETNRFFDDLLIPVIADNLQDEYDRQPREKLGVMVKIMGGALLAGH